MTELNLIPLLPGHLQGQPTQLINARLLHEFLHVRRDFSNWIKGRIEEYGFEQGVDYLLAKLGEQVPPSRGCEERVQDRLLPDPRHGQGTGDG